MLRYVLCDDDPQSLNSMLSMMAGPDGEVIHNVALTTDNIEDVMAYAKNAEPYTIYFLDLKLDDSARPLGLELCSQVLMLDAGAYVVYVSAYPQYALSCCQSHAFDFLVKPFTPETLFACVRAVQLDIARRDSGVPLTATIGSRIVRLDQCKILYFGRKRDYVFCHSMEGDFYWRESFAALQERLEPGLFLRTHNGYITNMRYVTEAITSENQLRLSDKSLLPYSRRNEKAVLRRLEDGVAKV